MSAAPASPPFLAPRGELRWLLPGLAVGLFLALLAALLWLVHSQEREEQRDALIADVLWVEQNLRLQMQRDQEQLQHLTEEVISERLSMAAFLTRARRFQGINSALVQVAWLDSQGRLVAAMPGGTDALGTWTADLAYAVASRTGLATYGAPHANKPGGQAEPFGPGFEAFVPILSGGRPEGMIVGVYSWSALLQQLVPWWFTERYRLSVVDGNGETLAAKTNVEASRAVLSHAVLLEPPGYGLRLQADAYRAQTGWLRYMLVALIVGFALLLVWSLWLLRRDVHRRAAVEHALRDEHAFRQAMEDSVRIGLRARDLQGRVIYVNRAFCDMVGWSAEELIGLMPPMPYWLPDEIRGTQVAHADVLVGDSPAEGFELRFQRRNGERFDALIYEAPLIDGQGRQTGWMGSVLDVTERKRAQELARQQQERLQLTSRLVAMGEMASTLAHELNQPLSAIASYNTACLNLLQSGAAEQEELVGALQKLGGQAHRAGEIIRRIYDFVRKSEPKRAACDINTVLANAMGFIEPAARRRRMRIELQLHEGLPAVYGDRILLEQVVLNLARNGLDAMKSEPAERRVLTVASVLTEGAVQVSVFDHGTGIAQEQLGRLFTPFYTTKPEGMGMGLNICRSIVEFHDGRLWMQPNHDGGAVFHFTVPLAGQANAEDIRSAVGSAA